MESERSVVDQARDALHSGDGEHTSRKILLWRILAPISWLLVFVTSIYYNFRSPHFNNGHHHYHRLAGTIWGINHLKHTPFSLNPVIGSIYWIVLFIFQAGYIYQLFVKERLASAINLAPTFTLNNLLGFGIIHLWCRSYFGWALFLVIVNWFNLTFSYFAYPKSPKIQHIAVLAGPLAWSFVSLYWVGAAATNAHHVAARVVANVFIWSWLVYGGFYLVAFKDWSVGFALSTLTAALGVSQFLTVIVALQWIFAFTIMAVLFVLSVIVAFPDATGVELGRGHVVSADREREPLLQGEA
ncbi:DUF1774-domain-containing protein [Microthyrium microscopicum]|uniref:DUF1774-domain-containing protein n=1 Tax=Microthyrium microscopicum TaxID=703497 RepID=A0A6A6U3I0_9PEZI|nr:DUF1774-domain-containing protein [Microthyrium microscopicum]